ncbi:MAG: PAS domain-containing protein [Myxococcota bacterium]
MPFASGYENDGALLRAVAAVSEALPTRFALLKVSDRQAPETGVVVYISHATQNRGIPMSMLLGRSASEVAPSLFSATGLGAAITRALTSGEVQTPDAMRLSSGDVVRNDVIKLTLHPLADDLVAIVYQNRSVEHELAENRAFLEAVVDNIPAVLFVKDADTLHFTLINRAAEALFGVPREQAYGKGDYDLFPREQADFFVGMDRAALRGDESVEIPEEPISTPAGLRWLHTRKVGLKTRDGR